MVAGNRHAEMLIPCVDQLLKATNLPLSKISCFLTVSGPGSFTGLRIAFASFKAFAISQRATFETLDGHEARAWHFLRNHAGTTVNVATRLTRECFLVSGYRRKDSGVSKIQESLQKLPNPLVEGTILMDEPWEGTLSYPLRAGYLAETRPYSTTLSTYKDLKALAEATPQYWGSTRFE